MLDILNIRRDAVLMQADFPAELQGAFKGMERQGNPWQAPREDRFKWAKGMDIPVPTIDETTKGNPSDVARVIGLIGHCTRGLNYLGLPAIAVTMGVISAWRYWSWLLAERN